MRRVYPHQRERLTEALARARVDALVATSPANVAYVTGFRSALVGRRVAAIAVFTARGTALALPASDVPGAIAESLEVDHLLCIGHLGTTVVDPGRGEGKRVLYVLAHPADGVAAAVAQALERLGGRPGAIGLDESRLTPAAWHDVAERLAGVSIVPAAAALAGARRVKAPWEIDCLHRALGIAEEALDALIQRLEPGMTEQEAAGLFTREVLQRDAVPGPVIVAFGERTAIPAGWPGERRLRRGELVRLDVACVHRGYHASVARTAVHGEPRDDLVRDWETLEAGLDAAVGAIRPGAPAARIHAAAMAALNAAGRPGGRGPVGVGIGLDPEEGPELAAAVDTPIEMGEVLRVELSHYEPGRCGLAARDTILVTDRSSARMNRSTRALVTLD
jgi:Xaa-Pro aminopeptidase